MCSGVGDTVALKGVGGIIRGALSIPDWIWVNSADGIGNLQLAKIAKSALQMTDTGTWL